MSNMAQMIHSVTSVKIEDVDSEVCKCTGAHVRRIRIASGSTEIELTLFADSADNLKIEL